MGLPRPEAPGRGYLLTYEQAILVSIASDAPHAPEVRHEVVTGYMAWKRGWAAEPSPRGPLTILEAMSPDATLSEVDLAELLDLSHPSEIRPLIDRRSRDLMRLGTIGRVKVHTGGRGRPANRAVFNRAQCLVLAMAALVQREAPPPIARDGSSAAAAEASRAVVALTRRSDAQATELAKLHDAVQRQAEDLAALRQRLADVEALPARRPADRIAAPTPGDVLGLFLAGCTRQAERGRVQASAIYAAWCDWCRITDLDPGGRRSFGARLRTFGLRRLKNGVNFYLGLILLPKAEWSAGNTVTSGRGEA